MPDAKTDNPASQRLVFEDQSGMSIPKKRKWESVEKSSRPAKRQCLEQHVQARTFMEREFRTPDRVATLTHISATLGPRSRVLFTAELLECILLQLDMQTLLVSAQRTCQAWRQLISTSPALQEVLFFKPKGEDSKDGYQDADKNGARNACDSTSNQCVRKNPLLASVFPAWFEDYEYTEPTNRQRMIGEPPPQGTVSGDTRLIHLSSVSRIPIWTAFASQPFAAAHKKEQVLSYRLASWRRMLVQQPPAYRVGEWTMEEPFYHQRASVKLFSCGLRMGQLYDASAEAAAADIGIEKRSVLWGAEGLRLLPSGYVGDVQIWGSPEDKYEFRAPWEEDEEARSKLNELVRGTDITILTQQAPPPPGRYSLYSSDYEVCCPEDPAIKKAIMASRKRLRDEICDFRRDFMCGTHNPGTAIEPWQDLPAGKTLWEWEAYLDYGL